MEQGMCSIYKKELDLCDTCSFWLSRFNIRRARDDGSVCVSCCPARDVRCVWLPM